MTATDRLKRLRTGIPSTFMVQDQNARAVLDAIREAVLLLTDMASSQAATDAAVSGKSVGLVGLASGDGIQVEPLGGGVVKVTCTITPGSNAQPSAPGASALADLTDVSLASLATGNLLGFNGTAWVNGFLTAANPGATVTTLGSAAEGAVGEDSGTWTSGGSNGCAFWIQVRQAYFHAGDMKWYAYARKVTIDKNGMIYSVSAEATKIEVEAPEAF